MRELKPLLITYSRSKSNAVDGLRQSLAEKEKKILSDITNLPNQTLGPPRRKSINLHSPTASIPGKILIHDESIHSGFVSLPSEPDKGFRIFEDEPEVRAPEIQPNECVERIAPPPSSDFWSPSRVANDSGMPTTSINKRQRRESKAKRHPPPPLRPDSVEPDHLAGYVWVCTRRFKLRISSAPDHFGVE